MRKRMHLKKNYKGNIIRLILVMIVLVMSFVLTFKFLYSKLDVEINNSTYLDYLLKDSFSNYNLADLSKLSSTEFLLKYSFGIKNFNDGTDINITTPVIKETVKADLTPQVYIYNSHQTEGYKSNFLENFNINNTVYIASHILKEYLEDLGIGAIAEENSIVDILNTNGWKYGYSYKASRILLENAVKEHNTLKFFIDIHRDSASYERTMTEIDGVKYARILFIVGLEHENYQANLNLAKDLNERLKKVNPMLSRGVLEKKGPGVNGKYNQDFNPNTILIEVGGQYNYIDEVNNSLKVMAEIIYDYLQRKI